MRKYLLSLLIGAMVVIAMPAFAGGDDDDYTTPTDPPPEECVKQITVDPAAAPAGAPATVISTCHPADSDVVFTLNSDPVVLGTVKADANGTASLDFIVPDVPPGEHEIVAECPGLEQSVKFFVDDPKVEAQGFGDLPRTGDESTIPLARLGLVLIAAGVLAVYGTRRHRQPSV